MSNIAFLVLFLFFMLLITIFPFIFRRWKVPSVIALLIAGMILGENGLDVLDFVAKHLAFLGGDPVQVKESAIFLVKSLGSLGLVFLMALAGMEADFKLIRTTKYPVIVMSIATFLLPAISGFLIYAYFRAEDFPGKLLYASLFASHSVGIVFPVIRELKISKTRFGVTVLISTIITDISSIILLAVSVQLKRLETGVALNGDSRGISIFEYLRPDIFGDYFVAIFLGIVIIYLLLAYFLVSKVGGWLLKKYGSEADVMITIFLLIIMGTVIGGEMLGINLVVGAFVAGLGLSRVVKSEKSGFDIFHRFEGIGYGLLVPFLFLSIGMETDLRILFGSIGNLHIVTFTVVGLVASKILSGFLSMRICGFSRPKGFCAGLMTVPQLSATLAAAAVGKDLGMLDANFFNAIIVLSIVTTLPVPTLVKLVIERFQIKFDDIDDIDEKYLLDVSEENEQLM